MEFANNAKKIGGNKMILKKTILIIIAVAIVVTAGYFVLNGRTSQNKDNSKIKTSYDKMTSPKGYGGKL